MDNKVYNDKNVNCNPIHTNANEITPTIKDKLTTKTEIIECEKEKDSRRFTGKPIYTGLSDRAPMFTMKDGFIKKDETRESDGIEEKPPRRFTGKPIYTGLSDRAPMFTMKDGFIPQTKTIESDKKEEKSKTLTLKKS